MIDFGKYNIKELANEGVEFHFVDIKTEEEIPTKFIVYGMDSDEINKARKEFNSITENKKVLERKKEEAMRTFLAACIKSWDDSKETGIMWNGEVIKSGDRKAFADLLFYAPHFQDQLSKFITDRTNFLA